jgi:hypothetical protein
VRAYPLIRFAVCALMAWSMIGSGVAESVRFAPGGADDVSCCGAACLCGEKDPCGSGLSCRPQTSDNGQFGFATAPCHPTERHPGTLPAIDHGVLAGAMEPFPASAPYAWTPDAFTLASRDADTLDPPPRLFS